MKAFITLAGNVNNSVATSLYQITPIYAIREFRNVVHHTAELQGLHS